MTGPGFAIIDFETTGLFPGGHDRVIEVAVVHADPDGTVTGQWDTLVNPHRDLGRQDIHRIHASDVMAAPQFELIAAQLVELLAGRVVVAHNASFDLRFLAAELERMGYPIEQAVAGLCTMQLAREFLPGSGRSLADCCDAYDLVIGDAHRAAADALATARLLECYIRSSPEWEGWSHFASMAATAMWPQIAGARAEWTPRATGPDAAPIHFLQRITLKLPEYAGPKECNDYMGFLDRCLLDRDLSVHETEGLISLAEDLGISRPTVEQLHREYFDSLAGVAWADGIITPDEKQDLLSVATLLGIDSLVVDAALEAPPSVVHVVKVPAFSLEPGDLVVLTGEMSRARVDWYRDLGFHGFTTWEAVTKKVKLVAAADPDSLSGKARKARKARDYGIPVVGESWLLDRWPSCH